LSLRDAAHVAQLGLRWICSRHFLKTGFLNGVGVGFAPAYLQSTGTCIASSGPIPVGAHFILSKASA
jgi:hypothetical protein